MLDVGTGTGAAADEVARTGARVVGIDRSLGMLSVGHRERPSLPVVAAEAIDLPFRDRTFDVVMGNFVFAHFVKVETALFDLTRVLVPGGRIGFTTWSDGKDAFEDTWTELIETVIPRDMLAPAFASAAPGHDRFKRAAGDRGRAPEGRVPSRADRAEALPVDLPPGRPRRGPGDVGGGSLRSQHARRGELGSFLERARSTFADRFPIR